jgi:heme-degrading monooxygenase HmoA
MFVVMNRFAIAKGREADFEAAWRTRERHLREFDGFVSFALLRNEVHEDSSTEYISHTIWRHRDAFEAWRGSEAVHQAHAQAPMQGVLAGPPLASLYDAVLTEYTETPAGV